MCAKLQPLTHKRWRCCGLEAWGLGPGAWGLGPGAWGLGPGAWGRFFAPFARSFRVITELLKARRPVFSAVF
ncbi:hypothetical protein B9Z51_08360 [Limnohabitans sp. T6-5]|nr:hypothetical protein B9Z51_08360 [Limnohabitans sp. T6-5]